MKIKNINIILLIILVLICIMLLYGLFNNKHHELYNEMNKLILKEKFDSSIQTANTPTCMSDPDICTDVHITCDANRNENCENDNKKVEYCTYLDNIQNVLKSSCFTCDEKKNIISTAKRVKCSALEEIITTNAD
jgi:hypothetical protein